MHTFEYEPEKLKTIAAECGSFVQDDEDEAESDEVSCVNCAYRRWGKDKIYCMKAK